MLGEESAVPQRQHHLNERPQVTVPKALAVAPITNPDDSASASVVLGKRNDRSSPDSDAVCDNMDSSEGKRARREIVSSADGDPALQSTSGPLASPSASTVLVEQSANNPDDIVYQLKVGKFGRKTHADKVKAVLSELLGIDDFLVRKRLSAYAHLSFPSDEARDIAHEKLSGKSLHGNVLVVEKTLFSRSLLEKQQQESKSHGKRKDQVQDVLDDRPLPERLADQVTPLWRKTYDEQILEKEKVLKSALVRFADELVRQVTAYLASHTISAASTDSRPSNAEAIAMDVGIEEVTEDVAEEVDAYSWISMALEENSGLPCSMLESVKSPTLTHYRNKCDFTFGRTPDDKKAIGFQLGLFKRGVTSIIEPYQCLHVSQAAKDIVAVMQEFLDQSAWDCYDKTTKLGVWRLLLVRTQDNGQVMAAVQIHPQDIPREEVETEKAKIVAHFKNAAQEGRCHVDTLLFQESSAMHSSIGDAAPFVTLFGEGHIHEELCGLRFRISPTSFFQVNTKAAELLYTAVRNWSTCDAKTVLLDLCCGTGTIGQTMSPHVFHVIGVEMVSEAVKDAERNARENGLSNLTYMCSKAEDAMSEVLALVEKLRTEQNDDINVVAVLDPPRAGVHPSVISAIRKCELIKRVVFVSCDANNAHKNFVDLCCPPTRKLQGTPFRAVRAQAFDLFPQTKHCELMLEFVRD